MHRAALCSTQQRPFLTLVGAAFVAWKDECTDLQAHGPCYRFCGLGRLEYVFLRQSVTSQKVLKTKVVLVKDATWPLRGWSPLFIHRVGAAQAVRSCFSSNHSHSPAHAKKRPTLSGEGNCAAQLTSGNPAGAANSLGRRVCLVPALMT